MFKKMLLPLDLTDRHAHVLKMAGELASQSGGELILFHVIETIAGLAVEEEHAFYQRLERRARHYLERLGKQLGERKITWSYEIRFGHRVQ
jgi:nucleotide-binding universal stress UspA family protein